MLNLVDTHIHLDAPELDGSGPQLLPAAQQAGIRSFIVPGVRVSGWAAMLALAEHHPSVYAAPGLHPAHADQWGRAAAAQLRELTTRAKVVAIGEIGLDGAVGPDLPTQTRVLRQQLEIALDAGLPVLLHARKATGALLDILIEMGIGDQVGGIWHGFSGSLQMAERLISSGFLIGVGPILLRANARKLPEVVTAIPLEAMVLETDLPDMAATPERLVEVASRLAELRRLPLTSVSQATTMTAQRLFGLAQDNN